jgi:mycothiol system anti-sigma-R factor
MSCGNHHVTPCTEVLSLVYIYIDDEIDEVQRVDITTHLDECGPCAEIVRVERVIKARVKGSCGCTEAPETLRTSIVTSIRATYYRSE